jgi:hypothetical protein
MIGKFNEKTSIKLQHLPHKDATGEWHFYFNRRHARFILVARVFDGETWKEPAEYMTRKKVLTLGLTWMDSNIWRKTWYSLYEKN